MVPFSITALADWTGTDLRLRGMFGFGLRVRACRADDPRHHTELIFGWMIVRGISPVQFGGYAAPVEAKHQSGRISAFLGRALRKLPEEPGQLDVSFSGGGFSVVAQR